MARTKETRRMCTGGKAPKRLRLPSPPPAGPVPAPVQPPLEPPISQGSAALPRGFLRGEWLTPGAKEQLQQELEPPQGKGLYQVVTDDDGHLCYRVVTDKKKLLVVSHQSSKCLEERSRVELITDQGHPCHTNPLPDVKLPTKCERPQLRVVFEEDVGAAGTVVGTYWGHLRTLSEEEELVHLEGNTCSRLLLEDCSVTLDLPGKPGGPPITLSLVADPDLCRMAVCNDPRTWEEEMEKEEGRVSGAEDEPAPNCHTETYLWVTQERGEPLYVPLVALVTSRRVEAGEEVTWSYGDAYWTAARRNMETYVKAYEEREAAQNMAQLALDSAEKVMQLQGPQASAEMLTALQCSLARAVQDMYTAHEHATNLWCELHKSEQAGPLEERIWGLQVWCQEQWWGLLEEGSRLMLQTHSDPPAAASAVPATAQQADRTRQLAERVIWGPAAKVPKQGGAEVAGSSAVAPPCAAAAAAAGPAGPQQLQRPAACAAAGPGSGRQQGQEQPAACAAAAPGDWRQQHRKQSSPPAPPPPPPQQENKGKKRCWQETVHVSLPANAPPEVVALLQKEKRLQQQDPAHPPMPRALLDLLLVPHEEQQPPPQQQKEQAAQQQQQSRQRDQAARRLPPLQPPPALLALLQEQQRLGQQQQRQEGAVRPPVPVQPPLQQQQPPPPQQQQQQEEAVRPAVPVQQQQQQMPPPLPRQPLPVPPQQQQQQQQEQQQQQQEQPQPAASVPLIVIPDDTPSPPDVARQWEEIGSSSKSAATVLMQQQVAGSDPGSAVGARGGIGGIEIPQAVTPHQQRPGGAKRCLERHWDDQQPPPQWEELEEQRIQQLEKLERQQLEERWRERQQLLQPEPPYCQQQPQEEEEVQSPQPLQQQQEEGCRRPGGLTQAVVMQILDHMRAQVLETQMQLVLQHQEQVAQQIGLPPETLDALRAKAFEEASKRMLAPVEQAQQQQEQQQQDEVAAEEVVAEEVVDLTGEDD